LIAIEQLNDKCDAAQLQRLARRTSQRKEYRTRAGKLYNTLCWHVRHAHDTPYLAKTTLSACLKRSSLACGGKPLTSTSARAESTDEAPSLSGSIVHEVAAINVSARLRSGGVALSVLAEWSNELGGSVNRLDSLLTATECRRVAAGRDVRIRWLQLTVDSQATNSLASSSCGKACQSTASLDRRRNCRR
jgi:hypothetical protein